MLFKIYLTYSIQVTSSINSNILVSNITFLIPRSEWTSKRKTRKWLYGWRPSSQESKPHCYRSRGYHLYRLRVGNRLYREFQFREEIYLLFGVNKVGNVKETSEQMSNFIRSTIIPLWLIKLINIISQKTNPFKNNGTFSN